MRGATFLAIACGALTGAAASAGPVPLFNGRDLTGWVQRGPVASFSVHDGQLRTTGAGNAPNWIHTEREFENFRLTFEYRLAQWAEAMVILRAPREGRPANTGIPIMLAHDFHRHSSDHVTGAIAGVSPPAKFLGESFDQWHRVEIELRGARLRVRIDDTEVQNIADLEANAELRHRLKRGVIGFPDMGYAYALRNVAIEDFGFEQKVIDLFDGRSLAGWTRRGGGHWEVHEGFIRGSAGHGILYAAPVLKDFEFTVLVRSSNRVNSGVFLRGHADEKAYRGWEVQIYSPVDGVYPTGSVYGKRRSRLAADLEGRWFLLQIRVEGARVAVRVDGERAAEYDSLTGPELLPGRIGLQIHKDDASVEFRDPRVRELP